jgi:hypothetical protein
MDTPNTLGLPEQVPSCGEGPAHRLWLAYPASYQGSHVQWLLSVIPATQKVEIRKISVQGQASLVGESPSRPGQAKTRDPI